MQYQKKEEEFLVKKLRYKSLHRGCKEMDFILSNFIEKYLLTLDISELLEYEVLLSQDDVAIYNWLIHSDDTPMVFYTTLSQKLLDSLYI